MFSLLGVLTAPAVGRADDSGNSFGSCCDAEEVCRQFYVGGIAGVAFATLDDVSGNPPVISGEAIFTAGGTVGMSYLRDNGALRVEVEGRGREQLSATEEVAGLGTITTRATGSWSAMMNLWRDYKTCERFGLYAGGGIGAGGYRSAIDGTGLGASVNANDWVSNFAWQAGGGVFYEISPRATLDLSYRYFSISDSNATGEFFGTPFDYETNFAASEVLLTFRVYDLFRKWRRR